MKKFIIIISIILFGALNSEAQSLISTLGGNGLTDSFEIQNANGDLLFRLNGVGNLGLGIAAPTNKLDIDGNMNITLNNSYKIDNLPVVNCNGNNTFLGFGTGNVNTGDGNTFVGKDAGSSNTAGEDNVFLGYKTGYGVTTSTRNVMLGSEAGRSAVGSNCIFLGYQTGYGATGFTNIFLGNSIGNSSTGSFNIAIGITAAYGLTSGTRNIFLGHLSGYNNSSGSYNIFIGDNGGHENQSGNSNVFIGYQAGYSNQSGSKNVFLGYKAGYNETTSDKLYIDNSSTTSPLLYGDFNADELTVNGDLTVTGTITEISDARYKNNIVPIENATEKIKNISGVYYEWNKTDYPELVTGEGREIGVLAQDVEKIFPELVKTDKEGFKSVNYSKLSAVLIEVVKEQQKEIEQIKSDFDSKLKRQEKAIYELSGAVYSLRKQNEVKAATSSETR